jgi:folate-binding protein YgfZ
MEHMKAALLPDRGVVKVAGDDARKFLNGLFTADIGKMTLGDSRFTALLTPQGKIIVDAIVTEAPIEDGGGFFLDTPKTLAKTCVDRLNAYKLGSKVMIEDRSDALGIVAVWDGEATTKYGFCYRDPRLPELGQRLMLPLHLAAQAVADLGLELMSAAAFEAHRIALGVPCGGLDFAYGDAYPHEADMDQLHGIDFKKGCFVGQEVVSRMERRTPPRTRVVPVAYDGLAPQVGEEVTAAAKSVGTFGSSADGRALALLRLDRAADALAEGHALIAGAVTLRLIKPDWIQFPLPGESKSA